MEIEIRGSYLTEIVYTQGEVVVIEDATHPILMQDQTLIRNKNFERDITDEALNKFSFALQELLENRKEEYYNYYVMQALWEKMSKTDKKDFKEYIED